MTVSDVSDKILDENFGLELIHSEGIDSSPSEESGDDISVETPSNKLDDSNTNDETILTHWGIKGMKWGVRRTQEQLGHKTRKRRFRDRQYEDETPQQHAARLQRESNERVAKTQAKEHAASEKRQLKAEADKQKRQLKSLERQQKMQIKSQEKARKDQLKQQVEARKEQQKQQAERESKKTKSNLGKGKKRQDVSLMTDQEVRDAIARMQLEKQYKDMSRNRRGAVVKGAEQVLGTAAKQIATAYTVKYATKGIEYMINKSSNKKNKQKQAQTTKQQQEAYRQIMEALAEAQRK